MSDEDFQVIRNAIYTHKVVVVKEQHDLVPLKQFEFVHRLDPDAQKMHGFDTKDVTDETIGVLGVSGIFKARQKPRFFSLRCYTFNRKDSTQSPAPSVSP